MSETKTKTYRVTVGSAFAGGRDHVDTTMRVPIADGQLAHALGTERPTAQQIAEHYAAEFCDSGSVSVVNTRDHYDRGLVGRRTVPA